MPYMLVGGLAVTLWGAPRSTLDVDVSVWIEPEDLEEHIRKVCARLSARPADPLGFIAETHVLPVTTSQGVRADLIVASLPLEREKDIDDARSLIRGNRQSLDVAVLEARLRELAEALARPGIVDVFREETRSAG